MIICPIQNSAYLKKYNWFQKRSRNTISQSFGNKLFLDGIDVYGQWDMDGHNGDDYAVPVGTPLFAPISGWIRVRHEGRSGYGLHIKLRSKERKLEICLGHLSRVFYNSGAYVNQGDLIALSGNTGFSTGSHLHFAPRKIIPASGDLFKWPVENHGNGFKGYFDPEPYTLEWKGTHLVNSL